MTSDRGPQQILVVLLVLAAYLLWMAFRALRMPHGSSGEWTRLRQETAFQRGTAPYIRTLTRVGLHADAQTSFSEDTGHALSLVLTQHPGYGRLALVPQALDEAVAGTERKARALRSVASQAIILGLLGTTLTFALWFFSNESKVGDAKRKQGAAVSTAAVNDPGQGTDLVADLMRHLKVIYLVNAVAIAFSLVFFARAHHVRAMEDEISREARRTLGLLEEGAGANLQPDLVAALEESSRRLGGIYHDLFDNQLREVRDLASKLEGLSGVIESLATGVQKASQTDVEALRAVERNHQASLEELTRKLDGGFQLLAQPFLQGIPAIGQLTRAARALEQVADRVVESHVADALEKARAAIDALTVATQNLPREARLHLIGPPDAVAGPLSRSVREGVIQGTTRTAETVSALERAIQSLAKTTQDLPVQIGAAVAKTTQGASAGVADAAQKGVLGAIGPALEPAVAEAARLRSALGALLQALADAQLSIRETPGLVREAIVAAAGASPRDKPHSPSGVATDQRPDRTSPAKPTV